MKFTLKFNMDNAAFGDFDDVKESQEVSSILRKLANTIGGHSLEVGDSYPIMDSNGNKIGTAEVTED